ncbi:MAG: DUF488 domain-containing protein [Methylacidiphilales bacterium]|nr:DUF488 domain-containing protein [Candidatus Methylacidiphilales bacterium]
MYYRRKIILALMQVFGGRLEKISLQKLLLLFTKRQLKPAYEFVPFKFGAYSFSLVADNKAMIGHGLITEVDDKYYQKIDNKDYTLELITDDLTILKNIAAELKNSADSKDLMRLTYTKYPYYAINSVCALDLLSPSKYEQVLRNKPCNDQTTLYTIGYEGISIENYFNRLIKNDIKVLVDVRRNAISMKFGFSRKQLALQCEKLKIIYIHIPEVGIASSGRQSLHTQDDYDDLFNFYKSNTLAHTIEQQREIIKLLSNHSRIALTCFEANINQCHRKHLSEAIVQINGGLRLQHI